MLQKIGRRIGIKLSAHRLRKSGGTHALDGRDANLRVIQQIMGHSDIRTTARYLRPKLSRQKALMAQLGVQDLLGVENSTYKESLQKNLDKAHKARKKRRQT